jgi:hypothetical protein
MGPMSRAELNRYKALKEELAQLLDSINTGFIKAGRILGQIRDERLYRGDFDTFEAFCRSMVGKDKRYVNRIIQAHGVVEELMLQGVKGNELPNSERLCRELAHYPTPDIRKIYQRAKEMSLVQGKSQPDTMTIREAAATVGGSEKARARQIVELVQKFERIARELARVEAIGWGDIDDKSLERLVAALRSIVGHGLRHLKSKPGELD